MPGYDSWKARNPEDDQEWPEELSQEQQRADWEDEMQQMLKAEMTEDILAMARAAQHDDRLADGALYGKLADKIEQMQEALKKARAAIWSGGDTVSAITEIDAALASCSLSSNQRGGE